MSDPATANPPETAATRKRVQRLAWLLDHAIVIPGTPIRFGVESLIGLIPGVGDALGLLLGGALVYEGLRMDAPRALILRMLRNSAVDALGGLVPVVGDVFDFAYPSNRRNALLLLEHLDRIERIQVRAEPKARLGNVLIVTCVFASLVATVAWVLSLVFGNP